MVIAYGVKNRPPITEEQMRAELLRLHQRSGTWPNTPITILQSPMRDKLKARGWIECRSNRPGRTAKRCWYITPAGRAELIDVPGSGITRSTFP